MSTRTNPQDLLAFAERLEAAAEIERLIARTDYWAGFVPTGWWDMQSIARLRASCLEREAAAMRKLAAPEP